MNIVEHIERDLADSVGRNYKALIGSGTSVMMIACGLDSEARPKIIILAMTCNVGGCLLRQCTGVCCR